MEIDIAQLAQLAAQTAAFLAPFLPYLIKGGKIAAKAALEKAGEIFSEEAWERAEKLWEKLKPKAEGKLPQASLDRAVKQPESQKVRDNLQTSLEFQLEDIFREDSSLAKFVAENINVAVAKDRSVIVEGGMKDSVTTTGDKNMIATHGGQIHQTINNFIQYDKNSDPKILQDQLINYLKWVEDYFEFIELRGIEQGESPVIRLRLDEVYIPLQAETWHEAEETDERLFPIKEKGMNIKVSSRAESQRIQLDQLLTDDNIRIIITGGPGCGKTTVLQHIAWSLAKGWLENSNFAEKKIGIRHPYPLPIYVPLNLYAKHLRDFESAPAKKRTLAGFISEYLVLNMVGPEINSDFFAFLLQEKDAVLLLLDGLDEVPTEDERIQVRNDIEKLISGKENLRMVVTSRTAAYKGKAMLGHNFQHIRVLPLQTEQIESMVRKAYNYRFVNSPTRAKKSAEDLIEGIQRLEQERQKRFGENAEPLVDSPLMVRMMLVVAANNRVLPNQRADLYDKTVFAMLRPENILDEKVAEDISKRVGGGVSIHREMLQTLAFYLHQRGENQGKEIDEQALREILEPMPAYAPHIDDLLKLARARGGVLDFRGGSFRFLHLSFQEFLAGRYLAEQMRDIEKISQFLEKDKVLDSWWREPILLLCGYLDINASTPARNLLQRLSGLDEDAKGRNQTLDQDLQIASAEIASAALLEFQQAIPDLAEQLANRLVRLIEGQKPSDTKLRAFAGDTLAKLGDPRTGVIPPLPVGEGRVRDAFLFCEIPAGKFIMGSSKKNDKEAYDDEEPQFEYNIEHNYFMSRYPVTNAQFNLFLDDPNGYSNEAWFTEAGKEWKKKAKQDKPPKEGGAFDLPNHPVVNVTWYEAVAFCKWLTNQMQNDDFAMAVYDPATRSIRAGDNLKSSIVNRQYEVRLPAEAEWEKAARGEKGLRYPWGDDFIQENVNNNMIVGSTSAVGCFPTGESKYGLLDMSGNVWEWCATQWTEGYKNYSKNENNDLEGDMIRVRRGGAFYNDEWYVRCASRSRHGPYLRYYAVGFRVVVASPISL